MSERLARLATTQLAWQDTPPEAMPYSDVFSLEAARQWSRQQIHTNADLVSRAGEQQADLAVATEDIAGLGYALTYLDDTSVFRTLAGESAAHAHSVLAEVARRHEMYVVACFFEPEGESIFNSAVLFGRDGAVIGRYHKVHLPVYETWLVTAGDSFPAVETDIGVVGMLICYDQMWPEAAAACALNGARIICHPSAASLPDYQMRARAMDSQVFYISSTRTGSRIVSPGARVLADAESAAEAVLTAEADIAGASLSPENYWEYLYSGIRDHRERHLRLRRRDAYRVLLDPDPPALRAWPDRDIADTPEAVRDIYRKQKQDYLRGIRGEKQHYTWDWSIEASDGS
jgi:predicted amidohydrolase